MQITNGFVQIHFLHKISETDGVERKDPFPRQNEEGFCSFKFSDIFTLFSKFPCLCPTDRDEVCEKGERSERERFSVKFRDKQNHRSPSKYYSSQSEMNTVICALNTTLHS